MVINLVVGSVIIVELTASKSVTWLMDSSAKQKHKRTGKKIHLFSKMEKISSKQSNSNPFVEAAALTCLLALEWKLISCFLLS